MQNTWLAARHVTLFQSIGVIFELKWRKKRYLRLCATNISAHGNSINLVSTCAPGPAEHSHMSKTEITSIWKKLYSSIHTPLLGINHIYTHSPYHALCPENFWIGEKSYKFGIYVFVWTPPTKLYAPEPEVSTSRDVIFKYRVIFDQKWEKKPRSRLYSTNISPPLFIWKFNKFGIHVCARTCRTLPYE